MEQLFASTDVLAQLDGELAKQGLSVANVADAYTVWWITVWEAANGVSSPTARATIDAVKRQAAGALLAVPAFATASDADKQNLAESLLVQAMLLEAMNDTYREDATVGPQLRAAAAQGARGMGLDLSAMTLTADGFVMAKQANPAVRASARKDEKRAGAASVGSSPSSGGWPAIHKVVFHMWGDQQFHPAVLFQDGTSYDVGTEALAATSMADQRRDHSDRFGEWTRSADDYYLKDDGRSAEYTLGNGGLFESFPANAGRTLTGRYKSVSGTTMGELSMLSTTGIRFAPDGRFARASSFAASGSGDVSGVSSAGGSASASVGTYRLDGHRIVLSYSDGRVIDAFFGFGSEGKPPLPDTDMIFIGDTAYVLDD